MKYDRWQDVVIVGTVEEAGALFSYIQDLTAMGKMISVVGLVEQDRSAGEWRGIRVLGGMSELETFLQKSPDSMVHYLTATNDNRQRAEFVKQLEQLNAQNLTPWLLRHPRAIIGHWAEIGEGSCIGPGSVLNSGVRVGKHCVIGINASISHESQIGDFCQVQTGAVIAGHVHLGMGCSIGPGAIVCDRVKIGDWVTIPAGTVVTTDLPSRSVPGRISRGRTKRTSKFISQ